jgi:hypothetical protein
MLSFMTLSSVGRRCRNSILMYMSLARGIQLPVAIEERKAIGTSAKKISLLQRIPRSVMIWNRHVDLATQGSSISTVYPVCLLGVTFGDGPRKREAETVIEIQLTVPSIPAVPTYR